MKRFKIKETPTYEFITEMACRLHPEALDEKHSELICQICDDYNEQNWELIQTDMDGQYMVVDILDVLSRLRAVYEEQHMMHEVYGDILIDIHLLKRHYEKQVNELNVN
jgi:hypothetical protein